jgi:hypothetical protein
VNKFLTIIAAFIFSVNLAANEMHFSEPTEYSISGNDIYGKKAYTINLKLDHKEEVSISGLKVTIYDKSIVVPNELLEIVKNPRISEISVTNDAGIFGSYFYIRVPFGKGSFFCKKKKYIYVSSLAAMDGGDLEAKIIDPCQKS